MAKTLQQRYALALSTLGFVEQKPTARYRVFKGYNTAFNGVTPIIRWYYLGKSGAFRWSSTGQVGDARACSSRTSDKLLSLVEKLA